MSPFARDPARGNRMVFLSKDDVPSPSSPPRVVYEDEHETITIPANASGEWHWITDTKKK